MDIIDAAQVQEESDRTQAINARMRRGRRAQRYNDQGKVICIDCETRIPQKRLKSIPDAVRCVDCENDSERREARR